MHRVAPLVLFSFEKISMATINECWFPFTGNIIIKRNIFHMKYFSNLISNYKDNAVKLFNVFRQQEKIIHLFNYRNFHMNVWFFIYGLCLYHMLIFNTFFFLKSIYTVTHCCSYNLSCVRISFEIRIEKKYMKLCSIYDFFNRWTVLVDHSLGGARA